MPDAWVVSLLVAAVPTAAYVLLIWWCDRYEKEPLWLLVAAFVWGAIPAVFLSLGGEMALEPSSGWARTDFGRDLVSASLIAPVVEELAKGIALFLLLWLFRAEFDSMLDGIIYGALIGFGFAMTENAFYFVGAFSEGGWRDLSMLAFFRSIIFGFNHAFFSALLGAGLGYARSTGRRAARWLAPPLGLAAAMGFHALHNFGATLGSDNILNLGISVLTDAGGVLLVVVILILGVRQERRWIREELGTEVGSLISADEYRIALSPLLRLRTRIEAIATLGLFRSRKVGLFYHLLAELAFRTRRYRQGRASKKDLKAIPRLREKVANLRSEICS